MAIMYGGEQLPIECPQFQHSALGPSLYTLGNIRYRVGDKSLTIYSFEEDSSDEESDSEEDIEDFESIGFRVCELSPGTPPDSPESAPSEIDDLEELPESSATHSEASTSSTSSALDLTVPRAPAPPPPRESELPLAYWVARSSGSAPRGAVLVGRDRDHGPLFVGRACAYGELLPGKVATQHRVCYVASEGRELAFEKYEVLTLKRGRVVWVRGQNGSFPMDAFPAGLTLHNQRMFVARARVDNILTPGRLVVGEKECRISYNMKEHKFRDYEILTVRLMEPNEHGLVRYVSAENLDVISL